MDEYRIEGMVADRRTGKPVRGLRVEARDKDTRYHDIVGVETTERDGRFRMRFTEADFGDFAPDRFPDLFFKVSLGERVLATTLDKPLMNVRPGKTEVSLEVDMPSEVVAEDRVDVTTIKSTIENFRRSDFRGAGREVGAKAGLLGSLVGNMVKSGVANVLKSPIRPGKLATSEVVGADVESAKAMVAAKGMTARVEPYDATSRTQALRLVAEFPTKVNDGDEVTLVEENGRVKYYAVTPARGGVARTVAAAAMRAMMGIPAADPAAFDDMRAELTTMKTKSVEKDRIIDELRAEVGSLREAQRTMEAARVDPERLKTLEESVRKLSAQRRPR